MKILVLGGVRSGKSRYAGTLASRAAGPTTLIATATAGDAEMAQRIAAHRASRPAHWRVIEEPLHLAEVLAKVAAPHSVVIVDCLTLWLTNLLCQEAADGGAAQVDTLLATLPGLPGTLIFVSNEVGLGIMPVNALARRFGDVAGNLHQRLATLCDRVLLMVAGLPLTVKE